MLKQREEAIMRVLRGERVNLRAWQRGDNLAQELWPRYTDPFSSLWNLSSNVYFDDLVTQRWSVQRYVWAIEDRARRMIGRISLREIDQEFNSARLGISLAQPYVGQGLGSEALAIFLDHYFGPLDFARLALDVAAFNLRAVRAYEQLGFIYLESEWRSAGRDSSLRLLDDPHYADLLPFFRRNRFETLVEFYEMLLTRDDWLARAR